MAWFRRKRKQTEKPGFPWPDGARDFSWADYLSSLEEAGYQPPEGLAEGLERLTRPGIYPGRALESLQVVHAVDLESPRLLAPGIDPDMLGSHDLEVLEQAEDQHHFTRLLAAIGLHAPYPGPYESTNLHTVLYGAQRLGWPTGRLLAWLRERNWVTIEPVEKADEYWPSHVAVFARDHLDELEGFVDSYLREQVTPITVSGAGHDRVVTLPHYPTGEPVPIGWVFRTMPDETLEQLDDSEGTLWVSESDELVFKPTLIGEYGDPFRGAPPDLFKRVEVTHWNPFRDRDVAALRHLADLEALHIGWSAGFSPEDGRFMGMGKPQSVTDASLRVVSDFDRLDSLAIRSYKISDEGLTSLPSKDLARVSLGHGPVSGEGFGRLVGPGTKEAMLELTTIPVRDCRWIANASSLERLHLKGVGLDDADLPSLAGLPLRHLDVGCNGPRGGLHWQPGSVGDRAVQLAAGISGLETFWAMYTPISNEGISALAEHPTIEELGLWGTTITDRGLSDIATIPQLRRLELNWTGVSDRGIGSLEGTSLTRLSLSDTDVTARCLGSILMMEHLEELDLTDVDIPLEELKTLRGHPSLSKLTMFHVFEYDVQQKVSSWLPGVNVEINPY